MALDFDAAAHVYRWNGQTVPSVTQIIGETLAGQFDSIPGATLEHARARGTAVHLACELDDAGELDDASVHDEIRPYLTAWRRFREEVDFTILGSERRLYSSAHCYAGTIDRIAIRGRTAESLGRYAVLDIKTGVHGLAGALQTAAYRQLVKEALPEIAGAEIDRFVVILDNGGRYGLLEHSSPSDWPDFLAALRVYRLRRRNF